MKNRKVLYKMLVLALPVLGLSFVQADTSKVFKPSPEPVFSTPRAKPNIHMVLDDSGSMKTTDVPEYKNGPNILRTTALDNTVKALLHKYRDKAYLGITFLYTANTTSGLTALELEDYSKVTDAKFNSHLSDISRIIKQSPGNTPLYSAVYDTLKMFRGQPVSATGNRTNTQQIEWGTGRNKKQTNIYQYKELPSPIRYRCQENHMIVMTDGDPNAESVTGVADVDKVYFEGKTYINNRNRYSSLTSLGNSVNIEGVDVINGVDLKSKVVLDGLGPELGKIIADTNLKDWVTSDKDLAGKDWYDIGEDATTKMMPLNVHSVSLHVDIDDKIYQDLTHTLGTVKKTAGMNFGITKKNGGSAEDLLTAFDTIFASIIRSTSSASAVNDRTSSALIEEAPSLDRNGNLDLNTVGTIRYDTVYDFRSYIGSVRAQTKYLDPKTGKSEDVDLWTTDDTILPEQGKYVTLSSKSNPGTDLATLNTNNTGLSETQVKWLTNFKVNPDEGKLRARLYPLGSITSPDVVIVNKDTLNINLSEKNISKDVKESLENWWLYKAKHQPNNLIIVGDNDGMISFIKAQRGLSDGHKAGERDTAYFPKMLVSRFDEIAKAGQNSTLVMEGRTDVVDAKVVQPMDNGLEHIYATIGLTAQGGGGRGLVGYRIYAEKEDTVKNWIKNKNTISQPDPKDIYQKVTPLFEITNETKDANGTKIFEDLGYTYSGFEFFNHITARSNVIGKESEMTGQAVAIFGNGFGADSKKSVLYFIDAYTGEKLHEILLNPNGMGAATPSILLSPNTMGGQQLNRIYVGDYSGTLYKIEFNGNDFTSDKAKITALFKAPETNFGQSAISVKPLVVKARNSNLYRVFFGTGLAASHKWDRYDNSLVQHNLYGITDLGKTKNGSHALGNAVQALTPVLTINDLKKGEVQYKNGQKPGKDDYEGINEYDLDIVTPYADPNDKNPDKDGWYIALTADGNASGERVIKDPQYDSYNDAVVFFTWAISERFNKYDETMRNDPCLADFIFGKTLTFSAGSGSASGGLKGLGNKGKTGKAEGGLTGEWIDNAPNGNNSTSLEDVSEEMVKELVEVVGEKNSAIADDALLRDSSKDTTINFGTSDTSGTGGSSTDIIIPSNPVEGKKPIRLSIQTLLNS